MGAGPYSLTARMALLFGALSFLILSAFGARLYRDLDDQVARRDDAALLEHAQRLQALLRDPAVAALVERAPDAVATMLADRGAFLVVAAAGRPLLTVNPAGLPVPDPRAWTGAGADGIHRAVGPDGAPFIAVRVAVRAPGQQAPFDVVAGRSTRDSAHFLRYCRNRILVQITLASLCFALMGYWLTRQGLAPLKRLAAQAEAVTVASLAARIGAAGAPSELMPVVHSLNAMLERLGNGFAQLSQVCADMAHDMRTPVNNLLGQTEVALCQPRTAAYYEALLASNFEELLRLSKTMDSMLFLARSEQADVALERETLDAQAELARVAEYFEGLAEERDLRIAVAAQGHICADATLLQRALANLVANAVRHARQGSTIRLEARHSGDGTRIVVENAGEAIPPGVIDRIFDRFYRADTARSGSAASCGLGLAIVRTIMTLHQGRCGAHSARGTTRFYLFFPAMSAIAPAPRVTARPARANYSRDSRAGA